MKNIFFLFITVLFFATFFSCKNTEKDNQQKAVEIISTQTLGLAYLEEFKLEEAEKEFLKYIELAPNEKLGYANLGLVYLRMGKYIEAEEQLLKSTKINTKDADVNLILATVYQMDGKQEKAVSLLNKTLEFNPNHIKSLYLLSELYAPESANNSQNERKKHIQQLVEKAPGNIVPALTLTGLYIRNDEADKAVEQLENIQKIFPEFPKEAVDYFNNIIALLQKSDTEKAIIQFQIFQNYMKVTFPYQSGIKNLKGPGGSVIGFPLITYDLQQSLLADDDTSILDILKFTDATASVGLDEVPSFPENQNPNLQNSTIVETGDYDGDGDVDIYVGSYDVENATYKQYLFNNDMSRFWDISKEVGLNDSEIAYEAIFADYDNDGFLDLYISKTNGSMLFRNAGKGIFKDVTKDAAIGTNGNTAKALFFDLDHDGDLDLFEAKLNSNLVYRNNGDGTFQEQAEKMGLAGGEVKSNDAAFGDFDDDGDIDLFVANSTSENTLYNNQRQGTFKNSTQISGLQKSKSASSVSVGDYNNDGFLDLFLASEIGRIGELYQNNGDGSFILEKNNKDMFAGMKEVEVFDTEFFDFDNDGFFDILIAGKPKQKDGRGLLLYHNEGDGKFTNVSHILPDNRKSGRQITMFDYEGDGDLDLVIAGVHGGIFLLRNDGGSLNHYVNIKLVGLRTGSAKNNYFGIGAKVEMRAGDLYQTKVVKNPNIYFGLGSRTKCDIIRITWTNGVPQNILLPDSNQSLIESQTLKGSCPFLYTWNGEEFVFTKDITWRSALGMPLGIMGGTTKYAFADASDDYIKIPGEMLQEKNGEYQLQMTSELWETIYMDKMDLVVVDHPDSIDIFVPEQFSPPPFPGLDIIQINKKHFPISAKDALGNDLLSLIVEKDDKYVSNFRPDKYQGITEMHHLILDPGEIDTNNLLLILNGWIFPTDASINVALSQSDAIKMQSPVIQVINKKGEWETVIEHIGFPMGKDKNVIVNLSEKFLSKDHRIRIKTNMEIYWDQIFFANNNFNNSINTTILKPISADLHYRGFSRTYKKGGRYGPHWFDYYSVNSNKKWRDLTGNYTRYGDVMPLLSKSDNQYIISNAGDETTLKFNAKKLSKIKTGWKRDFLIHSVGWVKDGDINTAHGNTVLPLPFHGMSSYPPAEKDVYPNTPELKKYNKEYNTRVVTMDDYRNSLKNKKQE